MKPKLNRLSNVAPNGALDFCQTPYYALDPLYDVLGVKLDDVIIWESACGDGQLCYEFQKRNLGCIGTDYMYGSEYDFFTFQPNKWDYQITNPPYGLKYQWLQRSYDLKKPFALLIPVETIGAGRAQRMFREYGIEIIYISNRIDFKMPLKGWPTDETKIVIDKKTSKPKKAKVDGGAQFPVAWFTWGFNIGKENTYYELDKPDRQTVINYYAQLDFAKLDLPIIGKNK